MSANIIPAQTTYTSIASNAKPSFFGLVGSELFKASRRWSTWLLFVFLVIGSVAFAQFVALTNGGLKDEILKTPYNFLYNEMQVSLGIIRVFVGFYTLIMTAYIFGLEYQHGTIRILISRGVGKVQLLFAKITSAAIISLLALTMALILTSILICALLVFVTGNAEALKVLNNQYWSAVGTFLLTILVNNAVTILLATTLCAIGRSLAAGLGLSLLFFPVDNIGGSIIGLVYSLTKNDFWLNVTKYLLGLNLNYLPKAFLPKEPKVFPLGATPLVEVDNNHVIMVIAVYTIVFLVISVGLTWKRDVKE